MSEKKVLNGEQLNKVTGGLNDEQHTVTCTISFYDASGKKDQQDVVITYKGKKSSVTEAAKCEQWCIDNSYTYIDYKEKSVPSGQIVA